ncbi:MAG: sigma-54-dependent transcriptional regulator [Gemmatimonadaceae bacterium]
MRTTLSILVIDDDETIRETLGMFFESAGHAVRTAGTATEGRRAMAEHAPDVVLVDLRLPDASGLTLIEALRADDPGAAIVVLTGHADVATAVRAMKQGADDLLEKPVDLDTLEAAVLRAGETTRLRTEIEVLRAHTADEAWSERVPASVLSDAQRLDRLIELAARNDDAPVLIAGETGTGKGWVARRIHELSARARAPFVEINCASLSATFFESELFGHEKGAFTDAKQAKRGLVEVAARGTVFLDEVAELAPEVQPKLLKVIEEGSFRRLGGTQTLRSEARVVVASHQPLAEAVVEKRFRADLFYRLQVLTLTLPPLRAQRERIPGLARALLPRGARLSDAALGALSRYDWPGNIRELKNALWRAAILAEGELITPEHFALGPAEPSEGRAADVTAGTGLMTLEEAERRAIAAALRHTGGNKVKAAALLGIARSTLNEKLKRLEASA